GSGAENGASLPAWLFSSSVMRKGTFQVGGLRILVAQPTATAPAVIANELREVRSDAGHDREQLFAAGAGAKDTDGSVAHNTITDLHRTAVRTPCTVCVFWLRLGFVQRQRELLRLHHAAPRS